MKMTKTYDTRNLLIRTVQRLRRFLATRMQSSTARKSLLRRYFYKARHRQDRTVKQYRHVPGTDQKVSYYLEPTLRQRIAAARKHRVLRPIARGWHEPTGDYPTVRPDDTFVGFLVQRHNTATAVLPRVIPGNVVHDRDERIRRNLNNHQMILSNAEGPLAP
jgi:hypothetical protein